MTRRPTAHTKSKLSLIIIGFFFTLFSLFFLLLVLFLVFKPKLEHKNVVFVPKRIDGGEGKILFAQIFPEKNELKVIELDGKIESEVIGGFGKYKLASVLQLLKIEKKDKFFVNSAFSNFFREGVDEVVEYDGNKKISNKLDLMKLFLQNRHLLNYIFFIKDLTNDQLVFTQIQTLEDWQKQIISQSGLKIDEGCTVAIVNTTARAGLAGNLAQILENSGVEVVRVTNDSWGEAETNLYLNDTNSCWLVKNRVQSLSPVNLKQVVDTNKTSQYRASMVLFVGDEITTFFED